MIRWVCTLQQFEHKRELTKRRSSCVQELFRNGIEIAAHSNENAAIHINFFSDASKVKFYQTKQKCCTRQKSSEWVHFRSWSIKLYRSKLNERKKLINLVVWLGFEFVCLFEFDLVLCLCVCVCGFYSLLTV